MTALLNDLSNEHAVINAIEANMFSFWMNYGRRPEREAFEDERLMYFVTGVPHPLFNAVFRAQFTVSQIEPTISEIIHHYSARRMPMFWWTGPQTLPSNLGDYLQRQGLRGGEKTPGMAMMLSDLPDNVPVPDDFQIEVVEDMAALGQWIEVVAAGNDVPATMHEALLELEAGRGFDGPLASRRYLGKLNGVPVTASALHLDVGVAGIYAVATLQEARGKGLGAAITLQPLLDARTAGYKVGILQASEMGYGVYKRLGFKDYCALEIYMLLPK